ncbi:hypothetical protein MMC26_001621 [Xylographa opegraphella]|nr:hypothetical protein [Xylographa opegraphella]
MNGTLSYGLNIRKRDPLAQPRRAPPPTRKTIFEDADNSDAEDGSAPAAEEAITTIGGLSTPSPPAHSSKPHQSPKLSSTIKPPVRKPPPTTTQYGDLSTNHTTALHTSSSLDLDPSIYDYDSVYDSLHAKGPSSSSSGPTGPKYMGNLLAAAEVRKRDQLRAKEKMLAKEREAEGEEFADKEKFVTGAYKAQQEEVRRMEAEEARREIEESERRRKQGGGMVGLYRGMLERDEKRHEEMVKAAEEGNKGEGKVEAAVETKSEAELAREKGATVNDDGVVVDKRQLLSAGLNIAAKPKTPASASGAGTAQSASRSGMAAGLQGPGAAKMAQRERQTRMLEAQLEEATKRAADDEAVQREALERAAKSRKTESDISGARQRYLERKKAAAAAAAAAPAEK